MIRDVSNINIINMSYSPIGQIYFEYTVPNCNESTKVRRENISVSNKTFRSFFAFGMDGEHKHPKETDESRDDLFKKKFVTDINYGRNWRVVIRNLNFVMRYDTVYHLCHYLRDNSLLKVSKDELVGYLSDAGCKIMDDDLESSYDRIKNSEI